MTQRNSNQAITSAARERDRQAPSDKKRATPANAGAPKKKARETPKNEQQLASERGFRGQMNEPATEESLGPKMNQTGYGVDALQRGPMGGWRDPQEVEPGTPVHTKNVTVAEAKDVRTSAIEEAFGKDADVEETSKAEKP